MKIELLSRRDALSNVGPTSNSNAGLWLERYPKKVGEKGGNAQTIEVVTKTLEIPPEYRRHFERWEKSLDRPNVHKAKATVQGRMVVGLGAESILETAITLHRTYGVPMIPGSPLKGLASSAAHRFLARDEWRKKTRDKPQGTSHEIMFGNTTTAGFVTFHDALLVPENSELPLDLDVMTVHHAGYYSTGTAPPADWDNPNPISFVTARGSYLLVLEGPEEWTKAAMEILAAALEEEGIGAKTAAGYGRLLVDGHSAAERKRQQQAEQEKVQRQLRERQAVLQRIEAMKRDLSMSNAQQRVPLILNAVAEEHRREEAKKILQQLGGRKALKSKLDREWVQELFAAAGESL
ncbi:MAG TPA: type III-B CRISPR module RAMP protein Cmr6 [Polyangium sp.]|nr:type III-B CRISPR module RAMP protein Cmr6 [Polyangium sp.]